MKPKDEKIILCNTFILDTVVNKLPPSWMSLSIEICRRKKQVLRYNLKRFIRSEDEFRTRAKNELLAKKKVSANMVTFKFDKGFFQEEEEVKEEEPKSEVPKRTKERIVEDWQVLQL